MRRRILLSLVPLAALLLHARDLSTLVDTWNHHPYAGHGYFVPAFAALMLWIDRDRLRAFAGPGHPAGALLMVAGLGLGALGRGGDSVIVQALGITVTVAGGAVWTFGWAWTRAAAFPLAFLAMMAPPPRAAIELATIELQLFAATVATAVLQVLDIPVYRTGVYLDLPNIQLQVAEICNGLRFLLALLVITAAFAYTTQPTIARGVTLVASAVPIAIGANAVRVAVIAVAAYHIGPQAASGILHHSIGKAVWVLTLVPLILLGLWLKRQPGTGDGGTRVEKQAGVA